MWPSLAIVRVTFDRKGVRSTLEFLVTFVCTFAPGHCMERALERLVGFQTREGIGGLEFSRVDRRRGSWHRYGFSGLFPELGQTLDKDVADRDEKDADKGRDRHAKHDRRSHDAA